MIGEPSKTRISPAHILASMIDQVMIEVVAGNGGRGAVSFHREKFVPEGGPDGGRGGRGGHVIVVANSQANTLTRYRRQRTFRAQHGRAGGTNNKRGRDGEDLILEVPTGTIVTRLTPPREQLADLDTDGDGLAIARGGRGGHGNTYFKSPTNRAPRVAQKGQPGTTFRLRLELRLIADIGLVGLPNAGKSTLLRQLTAARPRVGAYPFTTLEPSLGVVQIGWSEFVLADLPGLIEGAAGGAGLGHEFLRHATRNRLVIHLIDGTTADPWNAYQTINKELAAYSAALAGKPQIVVINKIDRDSVRADQAAIRTAFAQHGHAPRFLSAASGEGTEDLIQQCWRELERLRAEADAQQPTAPPPTLRPQPDRRRFAVARESDGALRVEGAQIETFVQMMDLEDEAAMDEVYRWLARRGVNAALRKAGLDDGGTVRIGEAEWQWQV